MARYYGVIGFAESKETAPGVWQDVITEKSYIGSIVRNTVRWNTGADVNEPMRIDNAISIIDDPYFDEHIQSIRYITWLGQKWKVVSVQVNHPRVIIQIGSEYHDQNAS